MLLIFNSFMTKGLAFGLIHPQVVDFVRQRLDAGDTPAQAAAALCDHCLAPTLYSTPEDVTPPPLHLTLLNAPWRSTRKTKMNTSVGMFTSYFKG